MSSMFSTGRRSVLPPTAPPGRPIASYRSYVEAQRAVDYLSDEKFPVQHVSIVGTDLKMVERVTGRLTYARVAAAGLFSGAYFGGFVGLLLALFDRQAGLGVLLPAVLIGCAFGMIFGVISYSFTGGRRDFTSTSQIVAAEYAVWCADEYREEATRVLAGLGSQPPAGTAPVRPGSPADDGPAGATPSSQGSPPPPAEQDRVEAPPPEPAGITYAEALARKKAAEEAQRQARERGDT